MGATEIGPVDYLVVAFPGNQFKGEIAPAIADLVNAGTVRIIDIAFVDKDANGESVAFELTEARPRGPVFGSSASAAPQAAAAPAAPAEPDYKAELEQLAQLKAQGILTEEEFEAKKKQILGI